MFYPTMLSWDRGILPNSITDHEVHEHVTWLFTEVLAVPKKDADFHRTVARGVGENGPLSHDRCSETEAGRGSRPSQQREISGKGGLLTILRRYDWTLHDRTALAVESALDPAMLGELFEQLILRTEGPRLEGKGYVHRKMPHGTYYTPRTWPRKWRRTPSPDGSRPDSKASAGPMFGVLFTPAPVGGALGNGQKTIAAAPAKCFET